MASSRSQYRGSFNRCLIVVVSFLQDILFRCNIESAVSMIELDLAMLNEPNILTSSSLILPPGNPPQPSFTGT